MLSRSLQTVVKIRERAALLRLYIAGSHVQPNLQFARLRNPSFSTKTSLSPLNSSKEWHISTENKFSKITRSCHSSVVDDASPELHSENSYARLTVINSKKAPKSIGSPLETIESVSDEEAETILSRDFNDMSSSEILQSFKRLSCHAKLKTLCLSREKHGAILDALSKNTQDFSNEELQLICRCLLLWKNVAAGIWFDFMDLWLAMDKNLIKRLVTLSIDEALRFGDYIHLFKLARKSKYIEVLMRELGNKPQKLSPIHFLHMMFLINSSRKTPINMYEMEYRFSNIMDEYTANELGVVAMAFFKTQTRFRDQKIVAKMQMKMMDEWNDVQDVSIAAIMKMARYTVGVQELQVLRKVLDRVKSRINELSIPCIVHVAHAAAYVQCYDKELMEIIIERFEKDIDSARIKDMERICWILTIFNYDSKTPLFHKIIELLRSPERKEEIERYQTVLPTTVMHLSHAGVFPIDLIQACLDPDFLYRVYNNNVFKIGWDFFALENNVKIEVKDYKGPFLNDNIRAFLAKKYTAAIARAKSKTQYADRFTLEVAHICKLVLDSKTAICIDQVLPHFLKPDIMYCLDAENNTVSPEPLLSKIPTGTIKYAPQDFGNLKWYAILLATQNQVMRESNTYIGLLESKIRQLKKIGYTPIVITMAKWHELPDQMAKEHYLRNILPHKLKRMVTAEAI